MTYWEALDIIENGTWNLAQMSEAFDIATDLLKKEIKKLDEAEDAKFREVPVKGSLYGTKSDVIFVDENIDMEAIEK